MIGDGVMILCSAEPQASVRISYPYAYCARFNGEMRYYVAESMLGSILAIAAPQEQAWQEAAAVADRVPQSGEREGKQ